VLLKAFLSPGPTVTLGLIAAEVMGVDFLGFERRVWLVTCKYTVVRQIFRGHQDYHAIAPAVVNEQPLANQFLVPFYKLPAALLGIAGDAVFFDPRLVKGAGVRLAFVGSQRGPSHSTIFRG
jgi:hypothetical protein